ncbi:DNA helicase mcm9 [Coemansia sp. RSA 1646]|nr:DNA helicase mcm9 [Coemansia sp. RSA 1646]
MAEVVRYDDTASQQLQSQQLEARFGNDAAVVGAIQLFLQNRCADQLDRLQTSANRAVEDDTTNTEETDAKVVVDMHELIGFNHELATLVLESPVRYLRLFEQAAAAAASGRGGGGAKVAVRIEHLPNHPACTRTRVPGSPDVGRLVCVSGTVVRTGLFKMMETRRRYRCTRCRGSFDVQAELEQYNYLARPTRCMAAGLEPCQSTTFDQLSEDDSTECVDYQEIKVQEQAERLSLGSIPRAIAVLLEGGLVDVAKSGDAVTVTGTVVWRWRATAVGDRPDIAVALRACSLRVHTHCAAPSTEQSSESEAHAQFRRYWADNAETPVAARNTIVSSLCTQVHGLFYAKLAVALTLIGGVARTDPSGLRVRGDGHLLLVGDPGTAKSQLLRHAARLAPRAVLTTGVGSTSAGLTVSAVKDGGEWQLEAGALVLADRGVCCIDEFGSIREAEKATILEAMEQQSISVAKAGIVCRLNARCSVVAAMNPKGSYDPGSSLAVNTALPAPLLSRFDLVLVLLDSPNDGWDARVSEFVLRASFGEQPAAADAVTGTAWSLDTLRAYFAYVKSAFEPQTTRAAELVLTTYYRLQRQRDSLSGASAARTTIRLLESLIRLAQSHARLMFRDKVLVVDAIAALVLMEATMLSASLLAGVDALHSLAPDDASFAQLQDTALDRLGLSHLK